MQESDRKQGRDMKKEEKRVYIMECNKRHRYGGLGRAFKSKREKESYSKSKSNYRNKNGRESEMITVTSDKDRN